jgi:phage tail sheath protein FI
MPTLTRPGVYVDESAFPTYVSASPGTAAACFVGPCPRGPLTPTVVNSWKEFTAEFGGFETVYPPSALHLAVFSYFSSGGTSAMIIRAYRLDAQGPVAAQVVFDDQNTTSAQPSLEVQAANPGAWGDNLYIDILPGTVMNPINANQPLTFTLQVKYKGSQPINLVERWENISMVAGSTNLGQNNYAIDIVNSPFTGSNYIKLVDLSVQNSTPSAPPSNNPAPTPINASVPLTGGTDGQPITFQDQFTALQLLDKYPDQPFVINLPGVTNGSDITNVVGYAQSRGDGFVVIDCPPGFTPQAMVQYAQGLSASPQAAVYYPQVMISDPYSPSPGVTRLIPPGGFVVGLYVATDSNRGVQKAPAGLGTTLLGALGLEYTCTNADQGNLTQANVNCLIAQPGSGVVIWGARTLSPYLITRYVPVERSLIYLSTEFVAMTKFAVFEPNDWVLWNQITTVLNQFLNQFWQSGGLQGQSAGDAFYITCDQSNNTPQSIQQGIVNIEVGVALQFPAEFVVIKIGQWAGGQSVSLSTT